MTNARLAELPEMEAVGVPELTLMKANLADEVEAYLRASEISTDRVEDARNVLKEGDSVTAMIINIDRKSRVINLSIKAKDSSDQQDAMSKLQGDAQSGTTNLGALLKAKLDNQG